MDVALDQRPLGTILSDDLAAQDSHLRGRIGAETGRLESVVETTGPGVKAEYRLVHGLWPTGMAPLCAGRASILILRWRVWWWGWSFV